MPVITTPALDGLTAYQRDVLLRLVGEVRAGRFTRDQLASFLEEDGDVLPLLDEALAERARPDRRSGSPLAPTPSNGSRMAPGNSQDPTRTDEKR